MRTAVVTASVGRPWHPNARDSVTDWCRRHGHQLLVFRDPVSDIPFRDKFFWMLEGFKKAERVVWLDDDIVVRADSPDVPTAPFAGLNVYDYVKPSIRQVWTKTLRYRCIRDAARQLGLQIPTHFYVNAGVMVSTRPCVIEKLHEWIRTLEFPDRWRYPADEAVLGLVVHLCPFYNLPAEFNTRWPYPENGVLPGYFNHFLMNSKKYLGSRGSLWRNVPCPTAE